MKTNKNFLNGTEEDTFRKRGASPKTIYPNRQREGQEQRPQRFVNAVQQRWQKHCCGQRVPQRKKPLQAAFPHTSEHVRTTKRGPSADLNT